jgi:hypothetical protein
MLKAPKRRKGDPAPAARSMPVTAAPRVTTPFVAGPTPTAPAPLAPVSGPSGGAPAPTPAPADPTGSGPANDPTTATIEVTPGQVFAASPQFWTPPPRPNRESLVPQAAIADSAGSQLNPTAGPEHTPAVTVLEHPAPQMAPPVSEPALSDLPHNDAHGGIPSGEIIQWTGFSGTADAASRLSE